LVRMEFENLDDVDGLVEISAVSCSVVYRETED
jgi:hypothetical protein